MCLFTKNTSYDMRICDWSADVCSSDLAKRLYYYAHINRGAAVTHIPKVERQLVGGGEQAIAIHLRPSGKPGPQLSAFLAASAHGRDRLRQKRSRADEGHLDFQVVPELRQSVQPGPAQKAANRRNPLLIRKKLADDRQSTRRKSSP